MPKTRIKERMKDYNRLLNKDASRVKEGAYKQVLDKLRTLMEQTEKQYQTEEPGRFKNMDKDSYQSLMTAYQEVQEACDKYFADDKGKSDLDKKRGHIVKRLQSYMDKDLSVLQTLDQDHLPSLSDAVRQSRTLQVDLTGKKMNTVGRGQNKRIMLKSAKGVKGFFTEKSGYDEQKNWESALDRAIQKVPEKYRKHFETLRNDNARREQFMEAGYDNYYQENEGLEAVTPLYRILMEDENADLTWNDIRGEKKELAEALEQFGKEASGIYVRRSHIEAAGIQSAKRLDQRNSAMNTVADLLRTPKIVAKAIPMAIMKDGKVVEGTFMEAVEGYDLGNTNKNDLYLQGCNLDSIATPQALKQFAELQILDYICGNIDRHMENMIYKFEKDKDGKPYLAKITGIDNDDSFGVNQFTGTKKVCYQPGLDNISAISQTQADMIQHHLNRDILKEALLPYEFSDEEMDAVWERMNNINEKIKSGKLPVFRDDQWTKEALPNLIKPGNIFYHTQKLHSEITSDLEKVQSGELPEKRKLQFAEGRRMDDSVLYRMDMEQNQTKLMHLVKAIRSADANLYINSQAFRDMRNAVYELGKFSVDLNKKYPDKGMKISAEDRQKLNELYEKMGKASEAYIDAKKLSPKSGHGQRRLHLANELRDLAADSCELLAVEAVNPQLSEASNDAPQNTNPQKEEVLHSVDEMDNLGDELEPQKDDADDLEDDMESELDESDDFEF